MLARRDGETYGVCVERVDLVHQANSVGILGISENLYRRESALIGNRVNGLLAPETQNMISRR